MPTPYGDAEYHAIAAAADAIAAQLMVLILQGVRLERDRLQADIASFQAEKATLAAEKATLAAEKKTREERIKRFRDNPSDCFSQKKR